MITDLKLVYPINKVLGVGRILDVEVEYFPKDENVNLSFSVSPSTVIKTTVKGQITALSEGMATLTVTDSVSGLTDVANITVVSAEEEYKVVLAEINENMTKGFVFEMNTRYGLSNTGKGRT